MINKQQIILLYVRQKGKCRYCGVDLLEEIERGKNLHTDHIIPKSDDGKDKIDNYALTCAWCNVVKRNKSEKEFLLYLEPYLKGTIKDKKELRDFYQYRKLKEKFKKTE